MASAKGGGSPRNENRPPSPNRSPIEPRRGNTGPLICPVCSLCWLCGDLGPLFAATGAFVFHPPPGAIPSLLGASLEPAGYTVGGWGRREEWRARRRAIAGRTGLKGPSSPNSPRPLGRISPATTPLPLAPTLHPLSAASMAPPSLYCKQIKHCKHMKPINLRAETGKIASTKGTKHKKPSRRFRDYVSRKEQLMPGHRAPSSTRTQSP